MNQNYYSYTIIHTKLKLNSMFMLSKTRIQSFIQNYLDNCYLSWSLGQFPWCMCKLCNYMLKCKILFFHAHLLQRPFFSILGLTTCVFGINQGFTLSPCIVYTPYPSHSLIPIFFSLQIGERSLNFSFIFWVLKWVWLCSLQAAGCIKY